MNLNFEIPELPTRDGVDFLPDDPRRTHPPPLRSQTTTRLQPYRGPVTSASFSGHVSTPAAATPITRQPWGSNTSTVRSSKASDSPVSFTPTTEETARQMTSIMEEREEGLRKYRELLDNGYKPVGPVPKELEGFVTRAVSSKGHASSSQSATVPASSIGTVTKEAAMNRFPATSLSADDKLLLDDKLKTLESDLASKSNTISQLNAQLSLQSQTAMDNERNLREQLDAVTANHKILCGRMVAADEKVRMLEADLALRLQTIEDLTKQLTLKTQAASELERTLEAATTTQTELKTRLAGSQAQCVRLMKTTSNPASAATSPAASPSSTPLSTPRGVLSADADSSTLQLQLQQRDDDVAERDRIIKYLENELAEAHRILRMSPFESHKPWTFRACVTEHLTWTEVSPDTSTQISSVPECNPLFRWVALQFKGTNYHCTRVQAVQDPTHRQAFEAELSILERRRTIGSGGPTGTFNPAFTMTAQKIAVMSKLYSYFNARPSTMSKANTIYTWHGCDSEVAMAIVTQGLASLASEDAGYFGFGVYSALEVGIAALYSTGQITTPRLPNAAGEHCALLLCTAIGMTYPVTRDTDYTASQFASDLFGKPITGGFDSRIIPVAGACSFQAAFVPEKADGHEIVVKAEAQVLPLAVVWFKEC